MAGRPQKYPHQICARLGDEHLATLSLLLDRMEADYGTINLTKGDGLRFALELASVKRYARGGRQ